MRENGPSFSALLLFVFMKFERFKLFRFFHQSQCLSIPFGVGHAKIAVLTGFGVIPLLGSDAHKCLVTNFAQTTDHGFVITKIAIAMKF